MSGSLRLEKGCERTRQSQPFKLIHSDPKSPNSRYSDGESDQQLTSASLGATAADWTAAKRRQLTISTVSFMVRITSISHV